MAFAGMKLELGDRDRLLMHRFTLAVSELTQEIKRYNDASEDVAERTVVDARDHPAEGIMDAEVVSEGDPAGHLTEDEKRMGVDGK